MNKSNKDNLRQSITGYFSNFFMSCTDFYESSDTFNWSSANFGIRHVKAEKLTDNFGELQNNFCRWLEKVGKRILKVCELPDNFCETPAIFYK